MHGASMPISVMRYMKAMKASCCLVVLVACASAPVPPETPRNVEAAALVIAPAPVSFDGDAAGRPTDLVFVLVPDAAPATPGVSLAAGEVLRMVMPAGFVRAGDVEITPDRDRNLVLTKGWPQGAIPVGDQYRIGFDEAAHALTVTALAAITSDGPTAPGIKAIHVRGGTFTNPDAGSYDVTVEQRDASGAEQRIWSGTIAIRAVPPPARIAPTNFHVPPGTNTNFQRVTPGATAPRYLGLLLWGEGGAPLDGVGIAPRDLTREPRYTGGLLVQDATGDGVLDPAVDRIVGGIIGAAPEGAKGQAATSPNGPDGKLLLSGHVARDPGFPNGGGQPVPGLLPVEFRAGDRPGLYRPTFELTDGNAVQLTISVEP